MNAKKTLSLRATLVAAFAIMILLSAAIGAIGILGMRAIVAAGSEQISPSCREQSSA